MKRALVIVASVLAISLTVAFGVVRAADANSSATVTKDMTHDGLFMRSAEHVTIDGTVNGDVIVAGSDVTIRGTVNGSVYAVGDKLRVTGPVKGNVHVAGSDVVYAGQTTGSVFLAGAKVTTEPSSRAGSGLMAGSNLDIGGEYAGSLYAAGSQLSLAAKITQDVALAGSQITPTDQAQIGGNLKYASGQEAKIANDRAVAGSISRVSTPQPSAADRFRARLAETFYWLIANLILVAAILRFAPRLLLPAEEAFVRQPLNNILKATAFLFLVPLGIILGLLTVVGIPLMLILGLIYILTLVLAPTAAAHWLGRFVWSTQVKGEVARKRLKLSYGQEVLAAGLGLMIVAVLELVPIIGGLVSLAFFLIGLGILLSRGLAPLGGQGALQKGGKA